MASLHSKIAAELRQRITSGQLRPGDFLPTEAQLCEQYGVSKNTVKAATSQLTNAGLLERVPGRHGGMRVREEIMLTHFASRAELPGGPHAESDTFFREVREQGFEPSQTFTLSLELLNPELAQLLEVEDATTAAVRRCLRMVNGRATSIQSTYYPQWLTDEVPELLSPRDIPIGTTQLLTQKGFEQVAFIDVDTSRMPTPEEAAGLDLKAGTPVLEYVRTGYTMTRAVRVSVHVFSGDSNRVVHTIGDPAALKRALEPGE